MTAVGEVIEQGLGHLCIAEGARLVAPVIIAAVRQALTTRYGHRPRRFPARQHSARRQVVRTPARP